MFSICTTIIMYRPVLIILTCIKTLATILTVSYRYVATSDANPCCCLATMTDLYKKAT